MFAWLIIATGIGLFAGLLAGILLARRQPAHLRAARHPYLVTPENVHFLRPEVTE